MTYEPDPICWCGHRRAVHTHYRQNGRAVDCGQCGIPDRGDSNGAGCLMFTEYRRWTDRETGQARESKPFDEAQRRAGQTADRALLRNVLALAPLAVAIPDPNVVPIPRQRSRTSIAGSYRRTAIEGRRR